MTHSITKVATTDLSDMLDPQGGQRMILPGFDDEFVDFPDYIIRITDRIWHDRDVELCARYYTDDWGIDSHTASLEVPIKIADKFTLYPSYRFYTQTAADYFAPANKNLSTSEFYTSDHDLSQYSANQFGYGVSYTDIFAKAHIWKIGLKSIDVKFYQYDRDTSFSSNIITAGFKFVMD